MDLTNFNYEKEGKEYIYLVMVEYKDKTLLKVGYTKTLENRMDTYELHNPDFQLLKIREGTRGLEDYMHKKFEKYKYPKREEWFYYNEEIINSFDTLEEMNFLDISKLKNKIINLLKPKSIEELKKLYYERYQKEIEDENLNKRELDISDSFSFINDEIESFIDSLDFSGIPLEIDPETRYQINIPNPTSSENISLDLEQILGRQRREDNMWKNCATMFVKTTRIGLKTTWEEFKARLDEKEKRTNNLLSSYVGTRNEAKHDLAEAYLKLAAVFHYKDNYVAVNRHAGKDLIPVFNKLMQVSEYRAFEVQQTDYADRFTVISTVQGKDFVGNITKDIKGLAEKFIGIKNTESRLKFIVTLEDEELGLTQDEIDLFFSYIPNNYRDYYDFLGVEGIRAHRYNEAEIKREITKLSGNSQKEDQVKEEIYRLFKVGNRYIKADIKATLKNLYERLGYQKTAKASDLQEYFEVKGILTSDKKNGFELLGKK